MTVTLEVSLREWEKKIRVSFMPLKGIGREGFRVGFCKNPRKAF